MGANRSAVLWVLAHELANNADLRVLAPELANWSAVLQKLAHKLANLCLVLRC